MHRKQLIDTFIVNEDKANNIFIWHSGYDKEDCYYRNLYPLNQEQYRIVKNHFKKTGDLRLVLEKKGIFTDEEDELIKKYYPKEGEDVYKRLDNKTKEQCRQRVKRLGISSSSYAVWTDEEDKILKDKYPMIGSDVATILNKKNNVMQELII